MNDEEQNIRNIVNFADSLEPENLVWKPIHSNNIITNDIVGYYALVLNKDLDGRIFGRKYSILFQLEENPAYRGEGLLARDAQVELYILFEQSFSDIIGPLEYPEPRPADSPFQDEAQRGITLSDMGMNEYGDFIRAYPTLELAKKRAVVQYQAVFDYGLSHLIPYGET